MAGEAEPSGHVEEETLEGAGVRRVTVGAATFCDRKVATHTGSGFGGDVVVARRTQRGHLLRHEMRMIRRVGAVTGVAGPLFEGRMNDIMTGLIENPGVTPGAQLVLFAPQKTGVR
jgi:hypothetical protein